MKIICLILLAFATPALAQLSDNDTRNNYTYPVDMRQNRLQIPRLLNNTYDKILQSRETIYYKLPQVYQKFSPRSETISTSDLLPTTRTDYTRSVFGVFYASVGKNFNANGDFPWEVTFGLNSAKKTDAQNYFTINFLYVNKPVLVITDEHPYTWIFPENSTLVGEIIYVRDPEYNYWLPLEVRLRIKTNNTWEPRRFAPIKDKEEFTRLTGVRYTPAKKYMAFRNPEENEVVQLEGMVERIPTLYPSMVRKLAQRPFTDVTKINWSDDCTVPSSDVPFNIFPKDYSLGLLSVLDSSTCGKCHNQTQISVRNLIPSEPWVTYSPTKAGNIRGSDGIFSWYPFNLDCVRTSEYDPPKPLWFRKYDVDHKIVEVYNPRKKYEGYKLTHYVQQSLQKYETTQKFEFLNQEK